MNNVVTVIAGPTATGKSELAAALAERHRGIVINADSLQQYAALPILTAQPGAALRARAPHSLYGVLDPGIASAAAAWAQAALAEITRARDAGLHPIVVGGTGLYLEALMRGLAPVPAVPQAVRDDAAAMFARLGRAAFHARLVAADPLAARLNPGDTQRLLRSWEVLAATGASLFAWQREA